MGLEYTVRTSLVMGLNTKCEPDNKDNTANINKSRNSKRILLVTKSFPPLRVQ